VISGVHEVEGVSLKRNPFVGLWYLHGTPWRTMDTPLVRKKGEYRVFSTTPSPTGVSEVRWTHKTREFFTHPDHEPRCNFLFQCDGV